MPRASHHQLSPAKKRELTDLYKNLISRLKKEDYITSFFDNFYTEEEKIMLAKRLALFILLKRDFGAAQIKETVALSYETIRFHRLQFAAKNEKFIKIIDALARTEENKEFMTKLEKKLKPLDDMLNAKTNMKARARLLSNDYE